MTANTTTTAKMCGDLDWRTKSDEFSKDGETKYAKTKFLKNISFWSLEAQSTDSIQALIQEKPANFKASASYLKITASFWLKSFNVCLLQLILLNTLKKVAVVSKIRDAMFAWFNLSV